jgi:autotransporter-associated beta strand protein
MKNLRHLVTLGLLASAVSLQAQITWVGETSASWGAASNWDLFRVPNTTEQVIFPSFGLNKTMSNNRTAGTVYTRLTFSGSGYTLNGTNSIALLGAGPDTLTFTTNAINNAGTITHIGTGTGNTTISSVIGTNVTGLTQNSSTSTLVLGGANLYTGLTTVSAGTLLYGASNVISTGAVTVNGASAILNLGANQSDTVGLVTLQGNGQINGTGTSTLTSTGTFEMQSGLVSARLGGSGIALNKTTGGTVTLTGANTYTGNTSVNAGTLIVNGSISTSIVNVASGATLGGIGTVGPLTIQSGGIVAPGNSPGILTVDGNYTQVGVYRTEIEGTTAGSGYDQISVAGTVNISGGTLDAIFSGSSYALNDLLFILLNDGTDAITGTYTGLAQGDTVTSYGGFAWQISYTANSTGGTFTGGNDIALRAIPEPSTITVAGIGLAMLLGRRSRSRKNDNNA